MGVYKYDKANDKMDLIAGGTLYADAPVGSIQAYGGTTAPSGWLLCQGQAVSRTEYADLFKAIGTAFGVGDGSTTFNVPDLREATTKGAGLSAKSPYHYDNSGLKVGQYVIDQLMRHDHKVYVRDTGHSHTVDATSATNAGISVSLTQCAVNITPSTMSPTTSTGSGNAQIQVNSNSGFDGTANTTSTAGTGITNEVKAVGVNYIIKATQVGVPADFIDAVEDTVETELGIKNITLTRVNVDSSSGAWAQRSGKVVNVNFAALVTLNQTTPVGTILFSGFPKPALNIVRFGLFDAQTMDVVTGLVQINSSGNLVADGQGLKPDTVYWGSFTYLTNE